MAKKKVKITIDNMEISSGDWLSLRNLETVYTLAAIQQRSEGHLILHEKYLNIALDIKRQLDDQLGDLIDL